jgi:cysteine desulfurase
MPYFDYNATTPLLPASREAWLKAASEFWQNPASPYREAARVKIHFDALRKRLAGFIGCGDERLVFTSGATEAANAILSHWHKTLPSGSRIAINPTEHPCVLEPAKALFGDRIIWLNVAPSGVVDLDAVDSLLANSRSLFPLAGIIVMAANNETGVLQPWAKIATLCKNAGIEYLCDATQWLGKLPASGLGAAGWFFGSAHKFGGPKGAGFLGMATHATSFQMQAGGAQQRGIRGGTEDFPNASALVAALAEAEEKQMLRETERLRWREFFEAEIKKAIPSTVVISETQERLWNTVALRLPHTENVRWVIKLDKLGFQISTGSACATAKEGPSHVLTAMGESASEARRTVRVSSGWETTAEEWNSLAEAFTTLEKDFRADNGNLISP